MKDLLTNQRSAYIGILLKIKQIYLIKLYSSYSKFKLFKVLIFKVFFDLKYSFEKIFTFQSSAKVQRVRAKTSTF